MFVATSADLATHGFGVYAPSSEGSLPGKSPYRPISSCDAANSAHDQIPVLGLLFESHRLQTVQPKPMQDLTSGATLPSGGTRTRASAQFVRKNASSLIQQKHDVYILSEKVI